jgi:F-type H+-transporting ATPase subunit b
MEIQLTQILFQAINFLAVTGALAYLLYKPVLKVFDERARRIEEGQKAAEEALKSRDEIDQLRGEAQTKLKKERSKILQAAQEEGEERKAQILAQAKEQVKAELEIMRSDWQKEKAQLLRDAKQEMIEAVVSATQSVATKSFSSKEQAKMAEVELSNILKTL